MHTYREQLKHEREKRGLKQYEVDDMANLTVNTTHKFEKGMIQNARIIEKIAEFYGGRIVIDLKKEEDYGTLP